MLLLFTKNKKNAVNKGINIIVNKIGFGGIPIQRVTKDEAKELVIEAVNAGVNFFDTARGYTCSEEYLGEGLALLRDKVFIAIKCKILDAIEEINLRVFI